METRRVYKKSTKSVVQLTSLLDLLFVMVFVSLLQQKNIPTPSEKPPVEKPPVEITKETPKPVPKKVETPKLENALVGATFSFSPKAQSNRAASGVYKMQGTFEADSRRLSLLGLKWIDKPDPRYDMVPLAGILGEDFKSFKGRIQYLGCKTFTLVKTVAIGSKPYSGKWEGTYDCAQGLTNLVLTID